MRSDGGKVNHVLAILCAIGCGSIDITRRLGTCPLPVAIDPHIAVLWRIGTIPPRVERTPDFVRVCLRRIPQIRSRPSYLTRPPRS